METEHESTPEPSFDLGASMDEVAGSLGLKVNGAAPAAEPPEAETAAPDAAADEAADTDTPVAKPATDPTAAAPTVRAAPKSWAKETHEVWSKLDPAAQDQIELREKQILDGLDQYKTEAHFGKAMRDVLSPYKPILAAQGIDEPQAVQYLMNAHYKLTQGTKEQRIAAYQKLGQDLRLTEAAPASNLPPEVQQLQERLNSIESGLTARQQAELAEVRSRSAQEVNAFASDPAHQYFDEVADDIVAMIQAGHPLKEAYEKAVWANPVTRQKEIARLQTESDKALKEKAKHEAEAARKASSANVRGRDTRRAPTEPKGTMDDTLHETLEEIRNRAH